MDGALRVVLNSHLFLGECRGGCKAARGAVGVKKIPEGGLEVGGRGGLHWR